MEDRQKVVKNFCADSELAHFWLFFTRIPADPLFQGIAGHDDVAADPHPQRAAALFQAAHQRLAGGIKDGRPALLAGRRLGLTPVHTLVRPAAGGGRFWAWCVWAWFYC